MSNREKIEYLCISYIRAMEMGVAGDYWRFKIHEELEERTQINEEMLKKILHNLDHYIGYRVDKQGLHTEEEIKAYANELFNVLQLEMISYVEDVIEFEWKQDETLYVSYTPDEWLFLWEIDMEFSGKEPILSENMEV